MTDELALIKKLYETKFNTPPEIIDYISVFETLKMCTKGLSNLSITRAIGLSDKDILLVADDIQQFLGFNGWFEDLDFDPLMVYNKTPSREEYMKDISLTSPPLYVQEILDRTYENCIKLKGIERKINEYGNS